MFVKNKSNIFLQTNLPHSRADKNEVVPIVAESLMTPKELEVADGYTVPASKKHIVQSRM